MRGFDTETRREELSEDSIRLDECEKEALKKALENFKGKAYIFGSRTDLGKRGGDIDLLLLPDEEVNPLDLEVEIQTKFFMECEEDIDVLVYRDTPFFREILRNAKRVSPEEL